MNVSRPTTRPPWGIEVFLNLVTTSVRNVDDSLSSFYYNGQFVAAWRDDSLCYGPFPPGYLQGTFGHGTGRPYTSGDKYTFDDDGRVSNYSWPFDVAGPTVTLGVEQLVQSTSTSPQLTFFVLVGIPHFVPAEKVTSTFFHGSSIPSPLPCFVVGVGTTSGTYSASQDLRNFPSDTHMLSIRYYNQQYAVDDMSFAHASSQESTNLTGEGFTLTSTSTQVSSERIADIAVFSTVTKTIAITRDSTLYVQRFVVPLTLVHLMLIWSHILPINNSARNTSPVAVFAITVSFVFVYGQSLPFFAYQTRFDSFFMLCYFNCFVVNAANLLFVVRWKRYAEAFEATKASTAISNLGINAKSIRKVAASLRLSRVLVGTEEEKSNERSSSLACVDEGGQRVTNVGREQRRHTQTGKKYIVETSSSTTGEQTNESNRREPPWKTNESNRKEPSWTTNLGKPREKNKRKMIQNLGPQLLYDLAFTVLLNVAFAVATASIFIG